MRLEWHFHFCRHHYDLNSTCSFWCFFFSWRLRFRFAPIFFHILYTFHWHGRFCVYLALAGLENYLVSWNISQQCKYTFQFDYASIFCDQQDSPCISFCRYSLDNRTNWDSLIGGCASSDVVPRRGKVSLVAFVWLFSTVRFQMSPQTASQRRGIVTFVALV